MTNSVDITKRAVFRAFTAKSTWFPIVLGCGVMSLASGAPFWIGAAAAAAGVASAIFHLTVGQRKLRNEVEAEFQEELNRDHYRKLRGLQQNLRQDKDPTTGDLVRKLRDTYRRMEESGVLEDGDTAWHSELNSKIRDLYESTIRSLQQSYDFWVKSKNVKSADLQEKLSKSRSNILQEVASSIEHLESSLDRIEVAESDLERPDDRLATLREELDRGMTVAKKVESRISELERDIEKVTNRVQP